MPNLNRSLVFVSLALALLIQACHLPVASGPTPDKTATLAGLQIPAILPLPIVKNTSTPLPVPTEISPPTFTPTPQNPLVLKTTLCWAGPGAVYEVISALKEGERVELLGQGSVSGWWIVKNPIYRDPCWAQAADLQLDPGMDVSGLKIYYPPPTPTYTATEIPTDTPTP